MNNKRILYLDGWIREVLSTVKSSAARQAATALFLIGYDDETTAIERSVPLLTEYAGISERAIYKAFNELKALGYIRINKVVVPTCKLLYNKIYLTTPEKRDVIKK